MHTGWKSGGGGSSNFQNPWGSRLSGKISWGSAVLSPFPPVCTKCRTKCLELQESQVGMNPLDAQSLKLKVGRGPLRVFGKLSRWGNLGLWIKKGKIKAGSWGCVLLYFYYQLFKGVHADCQYPILTKNQSQSWSASAVNTFITCKDTHETNI